ncbi:MAG: phage recombination protein Bet [Treponema sp.]|nr:phage recombination protein Bet [Treponema sp.]
MNELQAVQSHALTTAAADYSALAVQYLKGMGYNLPEKHLTQFVEICRAFNLNPFKREIYGVPYGNNFNIIVGYEVYLKRAERSGKLDGWSVDFSGEGASLKATITIHRKDWSEPFTHEVYFSEYNAGTAIWKSKPKTMLRKVAIAQGFRLCFPDELAGIPYTSDEIPGAEEMQGAQSAQMPVNAPQAVNKVTAQPIDFDTF